MSVPKALALAVIAVSLCVLDGAYHTHWWAGVFGLIGGSIVGSLAMIAADK